MGGMRIKRTITPQFINMLNVILQSTEQYTLLSHQEINQLLEKDDTKQLFGNSPPLKSDSDWFGQIGMRTLRYVARQTVGNCVFEIFSFVDLLFSFDVNRFLICNNQNLDSQYSEKSCQIIIYSGGKNDTSIFSKYVGVSHIEKSAIVEFESGSFMQYEP